MPRSGPPKLPEPEKEFLDIREAAWVLNCSVGHLYIAIKDGTIPHRRWGQKGILFRRSQLNKFIDDLPGVSVEEALANREALEHINLAG